MSIWKNQNNQLYLLAGNTDNYSRVYEITLDTTWEGLNPFVKEVELPQVQETDIVDVYPIWSTDIETRKLEKTEFNKLSMVDSGLNKLTFYCDEDIPTIPLKVRVEVGGKLYIENEGSSGSGDLSTIEADINSIKTLLNSRMFTETVLYYNVNDSKGSITLSDDSDNYSFITIYYRIGDYSYEDSKTIFIIPGGTLISLNAGNIYYEQGSYKAYSKTYILGGTSLIPTTSGSSDNGTGSLDTASNTIKDEDSIGIYRVTGYKLINI